MTTIGDLNHRINIEQRSATTDTIGQPVETWTLVAALWANIKHQSGLSAIKSGADVSVVQASIRIRYSAGIDAGMRAVHGSDIYDIRAVLPVENRRFLDLVCQKVL